MHGHLNPLRPWGFFDGASQGVELTCGKGFFLLFDDNHFFHVKMGLGRGSKNWAEVHAYHALISFIV